MKIIIVLILVLLFGFTAICGELQTFFIFDDDDLHSGPADLASVPLVATEGDSTTVVAYAGAIWGVHDLSGLEQCIAWEVRPNSEFEDWLDSLGYKPLRIEE